MRFGSRLGASVMNPLFIALGNLYNFVELVACCGDPMEAFSRTKPQRTMGAIFVFGGMTL